MGKKKRYSLYAMGLVSLSIVAAILWASQATATRHAVQASTLGHESSQQALVASLTNGAKVSLQTVTSANWTAPLSGLINLNHPTAKQASLEDHEEKIQIYTYHLRHPVHGDFLIDTGVAQQFFDAPQSLGIPPWLASQFGLETLSLLTSTDALVANLERPLQGVFITHLHLDHISGLAAIDQQVPLYIGNGETLEKYYLYAATRGVVDTLLNGRPALQQWNSPYVDVFGDGSVFAIHSPGHTAGSTAYLVNTTDGPVLLTGDASHTAWGWQNQVEPGQFSTEQARSQESLDVLIQLVKKHPEITVKLGHQAL